MRTPVRGRYNDAPGGPGQNRYPDERAGSARDRYIPRNPGGFRPQTRDYGARAPRGGHGDFGGYNNRPQFNRGSYADRDSRGFDDYNSGSYQGRHAAGDRHPPPGRFKSHGSYRDDGYRESQSASGRGSWGDGVNANNDGTQLNTPRKSRSRSPSPEREYGTWQRSPIPANENPIDDALESKATENPADGGIGFNEDVLFEAP
ncbi:hypothetical protein GGF43_001671 [Coemansia sp. RSA 2618]|nr:hypothetical protein GGF43_001671 [Coemansia sp. RSA 2618]